MLAVDIQYKCIFHVHSPTLRPNWRKCVSWRVYVHPGMYILQYIFVLDINCQHFGNLHQLKLYIEGCLCALRAQGSVTYIFFIHILILDRSCQHLGIYILDISCQLLGDMCQLEGFCPGAQLSGAQLSGAQLSGAQLSGAQFA